MSAGGESSTGRRQLAAYFAMALAALASIATSSIPVVQFTVQGPTEVVTIDAASPVRTLSFAVETNGQLPGVVVDLTIRGSTGGTVLASLDTGMKASDGAAEISQQVLDPTAGVSTYSLESGCDNLCATRGFTLTLEGQGLSAGESLTVTYAVTVTTIHDEGSEAVTNVVRR